MINVGMFNQGDSSTPFSRGNNMLGQFIQSIWFNVAKKPYSTGLFVVMKVNKNCSYLYIEKDMNSLKTLSFTI